MTDLLSDELLARIHERAPGYDRDNAFFTEDLDELAESGYLRAFLPIEQGGRDATLLDVARAQARLAAAAPATALAINMHLVWTGVARLLRRSGDDALAEVEKRAAAGEVLAFGISEAGNDLVLFGSDTTATPDGDGGYTFSGTKIFTSLAPAWTSLGVTGLDTVSPDGPRIVYALVSRDGATTRDDWDTLGMRASQSRTTILDEAHAPAGAVLRRLEAGPNADPLVFAIFALFETLISSVYTGISGRALELAVEAASGRRSKRTGAPLSDDPDIRWRIAEAAMAHDALWPQLESIARDVEDGVDHGAQWFRALVGLKTRTTETARTVVDQAIRVSGGSSFFSRNELSRLYRDVLAGMFHPSDPESAHATVATVLLGAPGASSS
ncbi:acyl-CoA dehydrogenase family protein [Labedella endophytica]|uniref:Acyl-CoA dehydrogenase n=1 Tax=Labedella endophytica TaxID=1523160 RepID=A0A3S0VS95_9MICO|nr:acyl-CoA dehydrogenase family protein [Labedella endophytica]RUQ99123.1 acyl-CoA dehydrogenase [Labedella endophytica]